MRSGRRQRTTSIFWNGVRSSGPSPAAASPLRASRGCTTRGSAARPPRGRRELAKLLEVASAVVEALPRWAGSQSDRVLLHDLLRALASGRRSGLSSHLVVPPMMPRLIRLKVSCARKISLCRSKRPRATHVKMVCRSVAASSRRGRSSFSAGRLGDRLVEEET